MSELVADCPRCLSKKITFIVTNFCVVERIFFNRHDNEEKTYEAFCICRNCKRSTVFILSEINLESSQQIKGQGGLLNVVMGLNDYVKIEGHICIKDMLTIPPPKDVPVIISKIFREAATCLSVDCYNAAGTMFRLCVDLATREKLPNDNPNGLNNKTRRDLGLRLPWLFNNGLLPEDLRELSHCIKEDGNDGAHQGTLTVKEAEDLLDFTKVLLERIYTQPAQVEKAKERREQRRNSNID